MQNTSNNKLLLISFTSRFLFTTAFHLQSSIEITIVKTEISKRWPPARIRNSAVFFHRMSHSYTKWRHTNSTWQQDGWKTFGWLIKTKWTTSKHTSKQSVIMARISRYEIYSTCTRYNIEPFFVRSCLAINHSHNTVTNILIAAHIKYEPPLLKY